MTAPTPTGELATAALALLRELVDDDPCWFDHHGGCQAHGYRFGEKCPHRGAKKLLARTEALAAQPPLDEPDQAEVEELADLIQDIRSRPGIAGSDTLAAAIIAAGYRRTPKEKP